MTPSVDTQPSLSKPERSWSDEELLQECLQGNEQAWGALIDKYRNLVYSVPVKYRMPPEDAADVFQAVWTDLFSELPRLRSAGALRSWLITVAGHKCYQWKRKESIRNLGSSPGLEPVDPQATFVDWRQQVEREQMLRDAIEELPERCREMVRLLFYQQPPSPYKEVADRLGLAEGSIGFIRGRCLKKLRTALETMGF
ncbi:MAG TPA: sigma-70 family RNA polymerase sigma factor [Bryobacteraceae bacterium]|nr:sigma-70 family RNA polymerase sigma factor [Bryobacteraceae bacterium]